MKRRIFVIDDEDDMILMATSLLEDNGYAVTATKDPESGLKRVLESPPDLLMLDVRMPGMDGLEVCKAIRANPKTKGLPIIMVSMQTGEADVVAGLEVGADDYVFKPFRKRELVARVKSVLRRKIEEPMPERWEIGPLKMDMGTYTAHLDGKELSLAPKEFQLLAFLIKREGHALTRSVISENVWGIEHHTEMRTINTHMDNLRRKLGKHGTWIKSLRGIGYRFEVEE